jgi:3',5'-cyclic AMP phosphodiesterase CpdA
VTDYLLVQISDIHLTSDGTRFAGSHPRDNLVAALRLLVDAEVAPDLFVLTGDLANIGEPDCYRDLSDLMDEAVDTLGGTVVYLPGNHDHRSAFRSQLLGQHASSAPINQIHWIGGLRVVLLDSVVPGQDFGALDDGTLAFLSDALASPAPDGTVLALHHPPIPSPVRPMARIMLQEPERLAEAIEGSDVRLVLAGHNHHGMAGTLASIPVWVSPATAYEMDVLSPDAIRGVPGASVSQIDLGGDAARVSTIRVPVGRS